MRFATRTLLAALTFAAVAWIPDLIGLGPAGGSSDLRLGALLAEGSILAFAVAFVGGVATSLTPCVYPLIPITVSIFGARKAGSRREAMAVSALYVLGIAAMYSALGVGAALTGKAFGSVMQNPWVIGFVAIVLAAMAASMFGAFELQLPASMQARLNGVGGAGRAGAFAMGLVSGIIAAPCTGPVLAAALTFVAAKGSVAFGFGIMFAYALGMGLLFFLIGAFSISLPKSGAWMETVKSVFGVALLAAALIFLKDAFPALKPLFSAARGAAFAAAGAAALGVLAGALSGSFHGPARQRLAKGLGVALLVGGIAYAAGAAGARERARAHAGFAWLHSEAEALALAKAEGRPVIIDFWADWCTACKELDKIAWAKPEVQEEAARFVAVKLDGTDGSDAFNALAEKYGVVGMPTVIFIDPRGREVPDRVMGAISAGEMVQKLRAVDRACEGQPSPAKPAAVQGEPVAMACASRW
ncbi:protein-disulfide reductase DsbD [Anaeromyxobacter sp. PSR-1]|uniref:protein-disulfide reductase DsbD family protein n=1 Tax=unclassified Anaeromyxobacter TaxID=2620896 RepID=UPI0005DB1947|nr:cytochrome c biogenesis protein CcdA [Anaeromyxobacter sp. PSR-1]GAO04126.1 thiol:disulfide interchange protein DsbD [Anaeromyxobacter sp. PSR-1]